mmetsp:Transcript_70216/g.196829  ORF Transcript_70216/g.196829 Transcript_70216/m.196829 type:complete len:223 (-) Transcript_70216:590-1258(-)
MLMVKEMGYKCCCFGSSMSGMVNSSQNLTGNCSHSTHSMRRLRQLFAFGGSAPRAAMDECRCWMSFSFRASTQASTTPSSLELNSKVMTFPTSAPCRVTCRFQCHMSLHRSQYKMSSTGMTSQGANLVTAKCFAPDATPMRSFAPCGDLEISGRLSAGVGTPSTRSPLPLWEGKLARCTGALMRPPWCQWLLLPLYLWSKTKPLAQRLMCIPTARGAVAVLT